MSHRENLSSRWVQTMIAGGDHRLAHADHPPETILLAETAARGARAARGFRISASATFALERERALRRSEHSASVHRLRQALSIGLVVWTATALIDWWVVTFAGRG